MESTAKYIVPVVGGPMDGAVLYLTVPPHPTLLLPRWSMPQMLDPLETVVPPAGPDHPVYKYLLQPSPARYIYEHLACS